MKLLKSFAIMSACAVLAMLAGSASGQGPATLPNPILYLTGLE